MRSASPPPYLRRETSGRARLRPSALDLRRKRGPSRSFLLLASLALASATLLAGQSQPDQPTPEQIEFFEKKVRPVLVARCQTCHNPEMKAAGLDLTSAEGFAAGAGGKPIITLGHLDHSRFLAVIGYDETIKMPPTGKLDAGELQDLTVWIKMGAPWPGAGAMPVVKPRAAAWAPTEEQKKFWAFQPVKAYQPPRVARAAWIKSPIDRFILAKLEAAGLQPARRADKLTLLRRATFDLTGLPPTEQEIADFLADRTPQAFERVVDRLLASPRYGERWGRHWLDVARYADSAGNDEDYRYPYAWRYRDYVIEAFNSDLPYDRFITEQLAGDLLEKPGELNRRGIVATGFLALGQKALAQQDKQKMLYDIYDEQLDVTSRAFLGLSITCARCHDHKFDPIATKDYYSLIGIFASTKNFVDAKAMVAKMYFPPLVPAHEFERYMAHKNKVFLKAEERDKAIDQEIDRIDEPRFAHLADYMLAAHRVYQDGATSAEAAREKGIDPAAVERWVRYLKPQTATRNHLADWYGAAPEKLRPVAEGYQTRAEEQLKAWTKSLRDWQKTMRERLKDRPHMPPPAKPKIDAAKHPFFSEVYSSDGPFALPENDLETLFTLEARERLAHLRTEYKELETTMPPEVDLACAVVEGEPVKQYVFIRGDHHSPGDEVERRFPFILTGSEVAPAMKGSGRLELARWLTRSDHPLTARVMANRIWHWHFGEGLSRTPNDFGKMGERPTHPELLDYLARRFIEGGWSVKKLHRLIMLSSTYQMGSRAAPAAVEKDPENRLWSRFAPRRLDVEEIRDGLLSIDGSLDLTMGGTLLDFTAYTDTENSEDRLSLDPGKTPRRMVYLPLRRANLPPLLNMFDFGDATTSVGKRVPTNVAPQALFMMNSEFIAERSKKLATALLAAKNLDDDRRIQQAYLRILNRRAKPEEVQQGLAYVAGFDTRFGGDGAHAKGWQSYFRTLMASNEFLFVE